MSLDNIDAEHYRISKAWMKCHRLKTKHTIHHSQAWMLTYLSSVLLLPNLQEAHCNSEHISVHHLLLSACLLLVFDLL